MAMRVCIYCKQDVTYERENRNMLQNGVVGFWTNPVTGQPTCPMAPVDKNGQQLHNVGDVHTPPVHDPEALEKFLDNTYVPPVPAEPCGQMYGLDDQGEFLMCGLDKEHDGDCAPATVEETKAKLAAQEAANSPDAGPKTADFDVQTVGTVTTITVKIDGLTISCEFDKDKVGPGEVASLLQQFPQAAYQVVISEMMGGMVDPSLIQQAQEAEKAASKPEVPKLLEDPDDIEKFLNDDE